MLGKKIRQKSSNSIGVNGPFCHPQLPGCLKCHRGYFSLDVVRKLKLATTPRGGFQQCFPQGLGFCCGTSALTPVVRVCLDEGYTKISEGVLQMGGKT